MCESHLHWLAQGAHKAHFPKGSYVFREGELANRFYLIQDGKVGLETAAAGSLKLPLQILSAGDVLGWSWLFPPYLWHFDARALEETTSIAVPGTRLREMCEADKNFGYEIMKRVADVVVHRLQASRLMLVSAFSIAAHDVTPQAALEKPRVSSLPTFLPREIEESMPAPTDDPEGPTFHS
jgi:CRP-like cAMP-binding protein